MMNNNFIQFVCPNCREILKRNHDSLFCKICNITFPTINEIIHFIKNEIYWSEPGISEEIMKDIVSKLNYYNWHEVLSSHDLESVRRHYFFISNLERAKWHKMINLDSNSIILDLGAGMGTISHSLARHYKYIFSAEPVKLRCEFMYHRFRQEKINNIKVIRANSKNLPFPDNFFDHIVLNGILEWIPYAYKNLKPRKAQLETLKKIHSLLKPSGSISLGIENRFYYAYFLGAPDCHIGIKNVTILPRICADIICRLSINDIYRPYTYSSFGLKKIISEAGFQNITIYASLPSYNEPEYTIPLESKSEKYDECIWDTHNRISLKVKKLLSSIDILKYFCYAFRVFAFK